jgi:hypothetical protein
LLTVDRISPANLLRGDQPLGAFPERDAASRLHLRALSKRSALLDRIKPIKQHLPAFCCLLTRLSQRDRVQRAEAHVASLAVTLEPEDPRFRPEAGDLKPEA